MTIGQNVLCVQTNLIPSVKTVMEKITSSQCVLMRNIRNSERRKVKLARIALNENKESRLDALIESYVFTKSSFDQFKKQAERENGKIKELMDELDLSERQVGDHIAKRIVQTKESMNMDRLLDLVKHSELPDDVKNHIIKTQEYVDMDCLEDAIYTGKIPSEFLLSMDTCRETKEVVTLRLSKVKRSKEED